MNLWPIILTLAAMALAAACLWLMPSLRKGAAESFRRGAFIAAVVALGVSALGLNTAVSLLKLHFRKLPLPLSVASLTDPAEGMPVQLGAWYAVTPDQAIDPELEQVLGTSQYLFRDYVDTRVWPIDQLKSMREEPAGERDAAIVAMQTRRPESVIRVAITYYTGLADTVAHIPERCYVAEGFDVSHYQTIAADAGHYPDGSPRRISYCFLSFEDQTAQGRVGRNVGYIFHVDGQYEYDSLAVRNRLASLRERYGYYAKMELMTTAPPSGADQQARSVAAMDDFFASALPELEKKLPDWKLVHEHGPQNVRGQD